MLADGMDRAMLLRHLEQAEQHMADGQRRLEHQRGVIEQLRRDGHDARVHDAEELLRAFEQVQRMSAAEVARIRQEIERAQ